MPIEISWGDPQQTILYCQFGEMWTLDEQRTVIDEMYRLISAMPHTVHIINDFTLSRFTPPRMLSIGPYIESHRAVNTGINIVVGATVFIKSILQAAQRMYLINIEMHMVNTVEEAYAMLAERQRRTQV